MGMRHFLSSARSRFHRLTPGQFWSIALTLGFGLLVGLGSFTFGYGKGYSYLTNNPAACANCHVMQDHYDAWQNSSHRHVATCNDCHLPHHFLGKYLVKSDNGFFHSLAFTTNDYPWPIQIKPRNARVTQNACLHCHSDMVNGMLPIAPRDGHAPPHVRDMPSCVQCHRAVGHALR